MPWFTAPLVDCQSSLSKVAVASAAAVTAPVIGSMSMCAVHRCQDAVMQLLGEVGIVQGVVQAA